MDIPVIDDPRASGFRCFLSDKVQMAGLLERLLGFLGPCALTVATFSVGEEFLRCILKLRKAGGIKSAAIYLDAKAAEKTARVNLMMKAAFDEAYYCRNHAKVMLLRNGLRQTACVVASQNMTRGNRLESYVVLGGAHEYDKIAGQFKSIPCSEIWKSPKPWPK